ncbi:MAG: hypothetical protein JKY95_07200 [Planctomycetaceae bacterium]|nr:hypothetical protein [Planctomycetaceae bacterium]
MSKKQCRYEQMNLKQLGELEFLLLGDLRDVLEEEASERNRKWLLAIVETLLKTVPMEFSLREQGGYLQDIVSCCPHADREVQQLLKEHQTLRTRLEQLRDELFTIRQFRTHASVLKLELEQWMKTLQNHNRKEEDLIQDSYSQGVGVGD